MTAKRALKLTAEVAALTDWGIPNWLDANAYPEDLTYNEWRWEFLRRREEYRQDWTANHALSYQRNLKTSCVFPNVPLGIGSWEEFAKGFAEMPGCIEKYGIQYLANPARPLPRDLFTILTPYQIRFASPEIFDKLASAGLVLMAFDLRDSVDKQIKKAKEYLQTLQTERGTKPSTRKHPEKWRRYLRVLDGRAAGATYESIGIELLANDCSDKDGVVDNARAAARAYQIEQAALELRLTDHFKSKI